jgi:hypothetical protein
MEREASREEQRPEEDQRESGLPGGGQGRRDEPGRTGVYPASRAEGASPDAPLRGESEWGQGERGAAGYGESGSSELNFEQERQAGLLDDDDESRTASESDG